MEGEEGGAKAWKRVERRNGGEQSGGMERVEQVFGCDRPRFLPVAAVGGDSVNNEGIEVALGQADIVGDPI